MKLLEKKSSNHRLGQGEINRSKKFHWYRKNSHSIREKKEKELHQLACRGSFANSTRTRNKITELLNKTVVDKGRGRRRDSVKNTDLSSSIDSKAHKYGSLPRFCLWLASIILAVGCIMADHSTGLKERKKCENGRTTLTPLPNTAWPISSESTRCLMRLCIRACIRGTHTM